MSPEHREYVRLHGLEKWMECYVSNPYFLDPKRVAQRQIAVAPVSTRRSLKWRNARKKEGRRPKQFKTNAARQRAYRARKHDYETQMGR